MKYETQELKNIRTGEVPVWLKISAVLIFAALLIWGVILIRDKMLKNANDMGMYLAQSYAWEEKNRIETYSMLLSICSEYVNTKIDENASDEEISFFLKDYSQKVGNILEQSILDPYAVINGKIIAANPWDGDAEYDYRPTEWYQKALNGNGKVIYTNIYKDVITGQNMVTLAVKLNGDDNVLAFDIIIKNFIKNDNYSAISDKFCYMLYGADDKIIYYTGYISQDTEVQKQFADDIVKQIRSGELFAHDSSIVDPEGFSRAVYYYEMSNGWLAVITIPVYQILQDGWNNVIVALAMLCVLVIGGIIIFMIRSYIVNQSVIYTVDTLKLLGDSYYEIYRLNYITGMYKAIKSPIDLKNTDIENYSQLISLISDSIEENHALEFKRDFSIENIRELISNGIFELHREYKRKFGQQYKWITAQFIYRKNIQKNEVVICFKEIDEQKKHELNQNLLLKNTIDAARNNIKQKTTFFNDIYKDVKNPLNTIINLTKKAQNQKDNGQNADECLNKIQFTGEQLLSFVDNLINLSRDELDKNSINYRLMDINKFIGDNLQVIKSQVNDKIINFVSYVSHPYVYGDVIKITQILNSLINNAIKYTRPNDMITVSLKEISGENNNYIICVEDTGVGMSEQAKQTIFEICSEQNSFEKDFSLPMVRMLVYQMNGEIYFESQVDRGSKFTVILPMQRTSKLEFEKQQENDRYKLDKIKNKYILLAQDSNFDSEYIIDYLNSLNIKVLHVKNGREAVNVYTKNYQQIDIILIDLKIPILDGFSTSNQIRELPFENAKTVPIIALTNSISDDDIAHISASGINTYINKPIDHNSLKQTLLNCIK